MSEQDRSHEAIEELAGAAALRALTPDEARFVAEHLAGCARCRALYRELARAADLLLRAPEPIEPPPELRARVMAEIARTPQHSPTTVARPELLLSSGRLTAADARPAVRRRRLG
ncbi:MAG TPA: zf-HC2 domain-containing protein, partial [Chloroflexota bacterium]